MDALVALATFQNPVFAELAKSKLESEGIAAFIFDANLARARGAGLVGWVKLMVKRSEIERAAAILKEDVSEAVSGEEYLPSGEEDDGNGEEELADAEEDSAEAISENYSNALETSFSALAQCPRCSSGNISAENFPPRTIFLSWLFLGLPFLFLRRTWTCQSCGHRWKAY
jgi:hypothetical protein